MRTAKSMPKRTRPLLGSQEVSVTSLGIASVAIRLMVSGFKMRLPSSSRHFRKHARETACNHRGSMAAQSATGLKRPIAAVEFECRGVRDARNISVLSLCHSYMPHIYMVLRPQHVARVRHAERLENGSLQVLIERHPGSNAHQKSLHVHLRVRTAMLSWVGTTAAATGFFGSSVKVLLRAAGTRRPIDLANHRRICAPRNKPAVCRVRRAS